MMICSAQSEPLKLCNESKPNENGVEIECGLVIIFFPYIVEKKKSHRNLSLIE